MEFLFLQLAQVVAGEEGSEEGLEDQLEAEEDFQGVASSQNRTLSTLVALILMQTISLVIF